LLGSGAVGVAAIVLGGRLTTEQAFAGLAELNVYYRILRDQGAPFPYASPAPFGALLQGLGVVLVVGWVAAAVCWWRRARLWAFGALVTQGWAIGVLIVALLQLVEPHHSVKAVSQAIRDRMAEGDVVAHEGSLEYSAALPFYTGRRIVVVDGTRGDLELASRRPEARGWFTDGAGLARLWTADRRMFLVTRYPRERSVTARLPAGSVHPLGQYGSRWLYSNRGD